MSDFRDLDELYAYTERDPRTPVLLADFMNPTPPDGEFRTATRKGSAALPPVEEALRASSLRAVPLAKTDRNPYEAFVFVGRASTCDVILRDVSVSKSHAVFELEPDGWIVRDNRSHNGTFVGERRLALGERARVASGDAVRFGTYPVYFMMPQDLRRILEAMGPRE